MLGRHLYPNMRLREKGYGLLELAVGLVLVGSILAGTMLFFQRAADTAKARDTLQQIVVMAQLVDQFRANMPPTTTGLENVDVTQDFRDMGLFPDKWTPAITPAATTPFKTPILISVSTQNALLTYYIIGLPRLPEVGCRSVLSNDYGRNLQYMFVRSNDNGVPGFINKRAATPSEAELYCKGGAFFLNLRFLG